ncbi:MAG TPA: aminotransferase class I/II-fold pyridoxal phosphate-dependent enzyme [Gaiellaceae bacterium]|jgi:dTDP-4-amino-4,6-dideoxygalactose transaminase
MGSSEELGRRPRRLYPRHQLDIKLADVLFALWVAVAARRSGREERVLDAWSGGSKGLVCLSVRTAFDLLLEALALERGDEIALSAISHPDMARIVEARGLRPLPVEIDPVTLAPRMDALERAVGPRTRMLVVAHLFGSAVDLRPFVDVCRRKGLLLVEDCAQSFRGPHDHGDTGAAVSLFSFGSIKTATALGGALVRVEDPELRARMRTLAAEWPLQPRAEHARRALRFGGLLLLGRPYVYWLSAWALESVGRELDTVVNAAVRGFPQDELLRRVRRRPSAPLLALLERRLRAFDYGRLRRRAVVGSRLAAALPVTVERPGRDTPGHTHWLFPVLTADPVALVSALRRAGFDASAKTSAICAISAPSGREELQPEEASRLMEQVVFVPAYPELSAEIGRLAAVIEGFETS